MQCLAWCMDGTRQLNRQPSFSPLALLTRYIMCPHCRPVPSGPLTSRIIIFLTPSSHFLTPTQDKELDRLGNSAELSSYSPWFSAFSSTALPAHSYQPLAPGDSSDPGSTTGGLVAGGVPSLTGLRLQLPVSGGVFGDEGQVRGGCLRVFRRCMHVFVYCLRTRFNCTVPAWCLMYCGGHLCSICTCVGYTM